MRAPSGRRAEGTVRTPSRSSASATDSGVPRSVFRRIAAGGAALLARQSARVSSDPKRAIHRPTSQAGWEWRSAMPSGAPPPSGIALLGSEARHPPADEPGGVGGAERDALGGAAPVRDRDG